MGKMEVASAQPSTSYETIKNIEVGQRQIASTEAQPGSTEGEECRFYTHEKNPANNWGENRNVRRKGEC